MHDLDGKLQLDPLGNLQANAVFKTGSVEGCKWTIVTVGVLTEVVFERRLGVLNRLLKGPKADFLWEQRSIGQGFIKDAIHQNHTNTGWILQWIFDALKCLHGNPL